MAKARAMYRLENATMYHESSLGGGSRIYNPRQHILHDNGLLTIKVTGYEEDNTHWTGWRTLSPSEPDYNFWRWMALVAQPDGVVGEHNLSKWKAKYAAVQNNLVEAVH